MTMPNSLLEHYTILVVEDDEDARLFITTLLKKHAKAVYEAQDGQKGLEAFVAHDIDIVVSDISMPNMDGLQMSEIIRKEDKEVPIIIQTAFDTSDFMMKSIDIGINKYLNKPIDVKQLLQTVKEVAQELENRRLAAEYTAKLEREQLEQNTQEVLKQLADVLIEPLMIVQDGTLKYTNAAFDEIAASKLGAIQDDIGVIDTFLEEKEGFCKHLSDITATNNKISVNINKKRRIYQVLVKHTRFNTQSTQSAIYVFEDVTLLEYQRLKLQNYSTRMEGYLIRTKYKSTQQSGQYEDEVQPKKSSARDLEQESLLRKSHQEKMSAKTFLEAMDDSIFEDVDELKDTTQELELAFDSFDEDPNEESLGEVVILLRQYAFAIKRMQEFDELAQALESTCDVLDGLEHIDTIVLATVKLYLQAIFDDLKVWQRTIFEEQNANDVHYLDASLFSSCLQLEISLHSDEGDDEDMEFF